MFFLKDPFTDGFIGPLGESELKNLALSGTLDESWEVSRSKDGPWLSAGKVKGLKIKRAPVEAKPLGGHSKQEINAEQGSKESPRLVNEWRTTTAQSASSVASAAANALRSQFDSVRSSRFTSPESIFDIFDWKFKKYLTPWILRITWAIVLVVAPLWILFQVIQIVGIWLPDFQWASDAGSQVVDRFPQGVSREPILPWWFQFRVARTLWQITSIAGTAIAILWIRVLLELAIVLFNIATTLTSIESGISNLKQVD